MAHCWENRPMHPSQSDSMTMPSTLKVMGIMPWLGVDHMIQQGVWPMGFSYTDPLANPDPLAKSRPSDKIQTHW